MSTAPSNLRMLVLRNGRLTRAFWMLKEAMVQPVRPGWHPGFKSHVYTDTIPIAHLCTAGYLTGRLGPRQKKEMEYIIAGDGPFMVLIAEAEHNRIKEQRTKRTHRKGVA